MLLQQDEINRLWEAVHQTSREVVLAVDPEGVMTFINGAVAPVLGVPPDECIGRDPFWMIDERDAARAKRIFGNCVARKSGWNGVRLRLVKRDGSTLWIETSGIPHVSHDGELIAFTATARQLSADDARLEEQRIVSRRIEEVIADGRLMTVWQPIFSLSSGHVVGVEALTRFNHPFRQSPSEWFRDADKVGLGTELELAAIESALSATTGLPEGVYLSLNMSPAALMSGRLTQAILAGPISPARVVVELTEHVPVQNYDALTGPLRELRQSGVRLAIDDAGAGFASFRHILRLAPDIIKLDGSITRGITGSQAKRALASAFVLFADEAGSMTVVAEGIEQPVDLRTISHVGVDQVQGFCLGRPVEPDEVDWKAVAPLCPAE